MAMTQEPIHWSYLSYIRINKANIFQTSFSAEIPNYGLIYLIWCQRVYLHFAILKWPLIYVDLHIPLVRPLEVVCNSEVKEIKTKPLQNEQAGDLVLS